MEFLFSSPTKFLTVARPVEWDFEIYEIHEANRFQRSERWCQKLDTFDFEWTIKACVCRYSIDPKNKKKGLKMTKCKKYWQSNYLLNLFFFVMLLNHMKVMPYSSTKRRKGKKLIWCLIFFHCLTQSVFLKPFLGKPEKGWLALLWLFLLVPLFVEQLHECHAWHLKRLIQIVK